ncbi:MAG: RNA methyltransferase PUA domain-containing protein, partial [Flavobacteriaceae bacterium]
MDLFYAHTLTPDNQNYTLEGAEAQHIVKVLRKKPGDLLQLTNGQGLAWTGVITAVFSKKIDLAYQSHSIQPPLPYTLHIAIAP